MKDNVKTFLVGIGTKVMNVFPMKNIILFESKPDFACNAYPVYKYFKDSKELSEKYRLMWLVTEGTEAPDGFDEKDMIFDAPKNPRQIIRNLYYRSVACAYVFTNRYKKKARKKQVSLFLSHGSPIKTVRGIYMVGGIVDYYPCQSHFFDEINKYELDLRADQLCYVGTPRCDALFEDHGDIRKAFEKNEGEKLIIWLPTYRKHNITDTGEATPAGLPLLRDKESVSEIEKALKENNVHLILKPHPAEDLSILDGIELNGIDLIFDKTLEEKNTRLYELLSTADAMITDYSSVYYDWLLCDRPTAVTTDDAEEYSNSRGLALDIDPLFDKSAVRLKDAAALCDFISDVSHGVDTFKETRHEVRDMTNMFRDGKCAQRAADFLIKKINEKQNGKRRKK